MEDNKKSVVTSYRLKEDTKDKIKDQLEQLGLTQQEYFNKAVSLMELENVKQNNMFAVNATELQDLTQRIYNLFIGLCDQGNSFLSNKDVELEELKAKYKDMLLEKEIYITSQNQQLQDVYDNLNVLQNENKDHKNELLNLKNDYAKQLEQLESNLADKTSLINEYKQKNDDLLSIVREYKQYKEDVEQYKKLLADAQAKEIEKDNMINQLKNDITVLNGNIEKLNLEHKREMDNLKKELLIEKKDEIVKMKDDIVNEVNKIYVKHKKEIEMYQGKYKELLDELEKIRNTPKDTKKNNTDDKKEGK